MRYRCEMMGVKTVPVFTQFHLDPGLLEFETRTPGEINSKLCRMLLCRTRSNW